MPALIHPQYRPDIDGLRALAVLSVVIFHVFPEYLPSGFIGVDIFFVISGFLICTIIFANLNRGSFCFIDFYSRRIRRIFPALIVVLISCWVIAWFALLPEEFKSLGKHILGGAGFVSNIVLWSESGYFDTASSAKPLLHLWSLGIEEQFYLVWPLLMWLTFRVKASFLCATLLILVVSFILNIVLISSAPIATFYSPLTRVWELLFGALLAWMLLPVYQSKKDALQALGGSLSLAQKNGCAFIGLASIGLSLGLIRESSDFPGWWALLPVIGSTLLLLAGPNAWINRRILSSKVMVWFGLISFPLYLWHWPLLAFSKIINGNHSFVIRVCLVFISIALAWLTYKLVEKPLRFGRAFNTAKVKVVWGLLFVMGVAAYMGYAAYIRDGIPVQRMLFRSSNPMLNEILTYKFQTGPAWRMGDCYLTEQQQASEFKDCGATLDPRKSTIFLWGDSHAAHLYPGFRKIHGDQYNLVYRAASACPPLMGFEKASRPYCKAINESTMALIKKLQPEVVLLAGNWRDNPWQDLAITINALKEIGISSIVVVGPVPAWENNLPKQIFLYCKESASCEIPKYMQRGLVPQVFILDEAMSQFFQQQSVSYLSAIKILCKKSACMIRVGEAGNTITAWDSEHLTDVGSEYLVSHFESIWDKPNSFQTNKK